jgi:VIT1/CCC1 family predicted Fe2+/Mn2+ transporter
MLTQARPSGYWPAYLKVGGMTESRADRLLRLQQMEATEAAIYRRLAARTKDAHNREVLERLAADEERHEALLAEETGESVKPQMWRVRCYSGMARLFGLTFAVKMLEGMEHDAAAEYRDLGMLELAEEEDAHEQELIGLLEEERLKYAGSVVLGMSDALVELTGALAGLTFALQSLSLVALAGLITGIAASFSMGASEYLSSRTEKKVDSPIKAGFFTWLSYILTVFLLVLPYLLLQADDPARYGLEPHLQALACTFVIGLCIVGLFNFYLSVVEDVSFRRRFTEMAGILTVVSLISFGIGMLLRGWLGVEV